MRHSAYLIILLVSLLALPACQTAPNSVAVQTQAHAWIDAPLDGSQLPLAPVDIVAHASDLVNIVSIELSVNGNVIATMANSDSSRLLATAQQTWTPPAPGNYTLRARALNSSSVWGEYAQAQVTIGLVTASPTPVPNPPKPPIVPNTATFTATASPSATATTGSPSQTPTLQPPTATQGSAPKPTATHTHTPQPTKTQTVAATKPTLNDHSVSASLIYWGGGNCTPVTKQVTIKASASDPAGIASVHLLFRLANQSNWADLAMSDSGGIWSRTLDTETDIPGYSSVTGSGQNSVALQFYFVLTNTHSAQTQSQTFSGISLEYCPAIK
jgi:hypothetical protein